MGGESVRVSVSPLWPQQCSKGFHKATETGNGPPQTEGATEHDLPRRYVADGRIKTRSGTPVTGSPGPSQAAGVQDQLGKVSATPNTQTGVSGPHNRHNPHDSDLTRRKGAEDSEEMPINSQQGQSVSEGLVEANRNDVGNNTGSLASPTTIQRASGIEDKNTEENTVLPDYGASEQGVENRAGVVDNNAQQVEWPPNSLSDPRPRHRDRCVTPGLGSGHRADEHRRPLVRGGENPPINLLELAGGALAMKTFTKGRKNIHVLLRMDNTTAIAYINRMGGTRFQTLSQTACDLWHWCLQRGITLSAVHLPGVLNSIADGESRTLQSSAEWMLERSICRNVIQTLGPCSVDLFATRLNNQLGRYVSWHPDPFAIATDAFTMSWQEEVGYAFLPFSVIGRCLQKVRQEGCTVVLVTPV